MAPGVGHRWQNHLVSKEAQKQRTSRLVEGAGAAHNARAIAAGSKDFIAQPDRFEGVSATGFNDYPVVRYATFTQQSRNHFSFSGSVLPDTTGWHQHRSGVSLCRCEGAFYPVEQRLTCLTIWSDSCAKYDDIVAQRLHSMWSSDARDAPEQVRRWASIALRANSALYVRDV